MAKRRGSGLLMLWADASASTEETFGRWLDDQAERLRQVPGFLSVGRYGATNGWPKFLTMCETATPEVLRSSAYAETARQPPPASPDGQAISNRRQTGYSRIFPARSTEADEVAEMSPYLMIGRMNVTPAAETGFNDWYNTSYIPAFLTVPGCMRARRFIAVEGQPKYLTVYEFAHPNVQQSEEWARARDNPRNAEFQADMKLDEGSPGQYRKL